ncbi:hypothetical protein BJH93_10210 [Kocuria polaris]|nr:hypothetical protein [Kocuria polaris]
MTDFHFPAPATPDPAQAPSLGWGIAGPGWIGERFAQSLQTHGVQRVIAVGSRSAERARAFADRFGIAAYADHGSLAAAEGVDVVYVATTHPSHRDLALEAIEHGKHVLIEKPIGITAAQADEIAAAARARGVFAGEAMWTVFLPAFDVVRQILASGRLGRLEGIVADYGEFLPPGHRAYRADLAGGPLMDLGIYLLALSTHVLGEARGVSARAGFRGPEGVGGVHTHLSAVLEHDGGATSALHTTLRGFTPSTFTITGSEASLSIDGPFNSPAGLTVVTADGQRHRWERPALDHVAGLHYQAAAVARAVGAGQSETAEWPLASARTALDAADRIRAAAGIDFGPAL